MAGVLLPGMSDRQGSGEDYRCVVRGWTRDQTGSSISASADIELSGRSNEPSYWPEKAQSFGGFLGVCAQRPPGTCSFVRWISFPADSAYSPLPDANLPDATTTPCRREESPTGGSVVPSWERSFRAGVKRGSGAVGKLDGVGITQSAATRRHPPAGGGV